MRAFIGIVVLIAGSIAVAQDKDKPSRKETKVKLTLVKIDAKGMELTLKADQGDPKVYKATQDTKFLGPRLGRRTIADEDLQPGVVLVVVTDGTTLKEVHLPVRAEPQEKKEKDK